MGIRYRTIELRTIYKTVLPAHTQYAQLNDAQSDCARCSIAHILVRTGREAAMAPKDSAKDVDLLKLDQQLCFALYSSAHALNRAYKPALKPLGLTYPQYLVMLVLWERDGVTVTEIGDRLHLDSGTLTPLLKRLEAMGLVSRARDAADERQLRIQLTGKGQALREKAEAVPQAILRAMGQPIGELDALKGALVRLRDQLNAATGED